MAVATSKAPSTDTSKEVDDLIIRPDIKQVFDRASSSDEDLQKLQKYIEQLRESIKSRAAPSKYKTIYRIQRSELDEYQYNKDRSTLFFDHPEWVRGRGTESHTKSKQPLTNFELYLEKNKDISFIVYKIFNEVSTDSNESDRTAPRPQPANEAVQLINKDLISAIVTLLNSRPQYAELARAYSQSHELPAPYLVFFHSRKSLGNFQASLSGQSKAQFSILLNYVTELYADEYATADSLLSQSKISPKFLRYLFKPGDLLISRVEGHYQGYVSDSWPMKIHTATRMRPATSRMGTVMPLYGSQEADMRLANDKITVHSCEVNAWHWNFDGNFQRQSSKLCLEFVEYGKNDTDINAKGRLIVQGDKPGNDINEKNISDLNIFPMQYASVEIVDNCRRRGRTFWKCRTRSYISYQATERDRIQSLVSCFVKSR